MKLNPPNVNTTSHRSTWQQPAGAGGEGLATGGWFLPLKGFAWLQAERFAGSSQAWIPGCQERLSAIPPFGWLPLTLLLSYKYAFPASSSILAPTHSQMRAESACSEQKPSLDSKEPFFFPRSSAEWYKDLPKKGTHPCPMPTQQPQETCYQDRHIEKIIYTIPGD